ncbi:hypothetical protein AGDE_13138 [Angomonas deanei]|uniref:Uncharacterized protein n=1 Tax=Angomonas deanei TaxID=59799 RepID=A0A7G2C743_9TRYP|nr:hypothetical protein AGDE_13138 [Angomonas deanei]CAD2215566.1 hypothetical protein, conserved [Angomonas deanei]|eukprot:EPY22703.1 hypothetical protein AGDE_13138 [Angomonas deanei]
MIFCDRRNCTYAAHLDCLHFEERPVTFVCASCQGALPSPLSAYEEEPAEEGKHAPTRREGKKIPMKLPIPQASKRPRPPTQADDDLYFLRPTKHSLAAMQSLKSMKEEQEAISSKRDLYFMEKARRNYELSNDSAVTRQDGFSIDRSEILNSEKRRKLESRLIRQFAKDMLPVVLEQQAVQSARLVLDSKGGINYNPQRRHNSPRRVTRGWRQWRRPEWRCGTSWTPWYGRRG